MGVAISALLLPVALVCSGIAFPAMLFERALPRAPEPVGLKWGDDGSVFHNLKNISTEFVRADLQWWSFFAMARILGSIGNLDLVRRQRRTAQRSNRHFSILGVLRLTHD